MRPFSVSAIGTRRFYRSGLPLDDPFGLPPFRRITFQHHFQVMCRVHLNRCQTSQKLVTTHNYSTKRHSPLQPQHNTQLQYSAKRGSPLQPQQLPSPIIPLTLLKFANPRVKIVQKWLALRQYWRYTIITYRQNWRSASYLFGELRIGVKLKRKLTSIQFYYSSIRTIFYFSPKNIKQL